MKRELMLVIDEHIEKIRDFLIAEGVSGRIEFKLLEKDKPTYASFVIVSPHIKENAQNQ